MTTDQTKERLSATDWMQRGGFGVHVSTVAKQTGAGEDELRELAKAGFESGGTKLSYRQDGYIFFTNAEKAAAFQRKLSVASSDPPPAAGAPARAHERDAYAAGRRNGATSREYQRGVADEQGGDAGARSSPVRAGSGDSQGGGPFAGRAAMEDLDAQSRREWDSNRELREEFPNFEAYAAFKRAEGRGLVGPIRHGGGVVCGEDVRRELGGK